MAPGSNGFISLNDLIQSRAAALEADDFGKLDVDHFERELAGAGEYMPKDALSFMLAGDTVPYLIRVGHSAAEINRMWSAVRGALVRLGLPLPKVLRY